MKTTLLYLFGFLLLVGCAKPEEENKPVAPTESFCFPAQAVEYNTPQNGQPWSLEERYVYNEKGELTAVKYYAAGEQVWEDRFEYDLKGLLVRENWWQQNSLKKFFLYEYDAQGKLVNFTENDYESHQQITTLFSKTVLTYTSPTQLNTMQIFKPVNGALQLDFTNKYTYTDGLMNKVSAYNSDNQLIRETVLTYDDKKSYMRGLPSYRAQRVGEGFPHEHNIIARKVTDSSGNSLLSQSYKRETAYNEQGYLTYAYTVYEDGRRLERNLVYTCPKN